MFILSYICSLYYLAIDPIFCLIHWLVSMLGLARITPMK
jgi:hypothetical protein